MSLTPDTLAEIKKLRKCAKGIIKHFDKMHESTRMILEFTMRLKGLSIDEFLENQKELVRRCDEAIQKNKPCI